MTSESFITSSADHQDAVFRLVQYSAKVVSAMHYGRRREALAGLSSAIDASRIMNRTFGIVYALRAVLTGRDAPLLSRLTDLSLLLYHPCETGYWLLLVSHSKNATRRRLYSRLSALFGCLWSLLASYAVARRLRQLHTARLAVQEAQGRARDEPAKRSGGGALQLRDEDDELAADAAAIAAEVASERQRMAKLLFDAVLNLNWAVDHPTRGFSPFVVGLLGTCSAWLGLRMAFHAHVQAVLAAEAEDAKWAEFDDGAALGGPEAVEDMSDHGEQQADEVADQEKPPWCASQ